MSEFAFGFKFNEEDKEMLLEAQRNLVGTRYATKTGAFRLGLRKMNQELLETGKIKVV